MRIYEIIEDYLKQRRTGIIATVITRAGSTPRDVGAKMFVGEAGELYGTIGGGRLEHGASLGARLDFSVVASAQS